MRKPTTLVVAIATVILLVGGSTVVHASREKLTISYSSTSFSSALTSQVLSPTVSGGVAARFSFTGKLPQSVSFDSATGTFSGPPEWNANIGQIGGGFLHTCGVTTTGAVKCIGKNESGQLGDGTTTTRSTATSVVGLESGVAAVSGGGEYSCALLASSRAKCWGANNVGQLGNSALISSATPVDVRTSASDGTPLSGVTILSAGFEHACARTGTGNLRCWGSNAYGQAGNNTFGNPNTAPVAVHTSSSDATPLSGVTAVVAGGFHTCALMQSGGVKCWGDNDYGQLGNGTTEDQSAPVDVRASASNASPLTGVVALSAGYISSCALLASGGVKCWGDNGFGQLGNGTTVNQSSPVDVRTSATNARPLSGVAAISLGHGHVCALTTAGGVRCWGDNQAGQLGDGSTKLSGAPVVVRSTPTKRAPLAKVASISVGAFFSCARMPNGLAKCWGDNSSGALGDGTYDNRRGPVDVIGSGPVVGFPASLRVTVRTTDGRSASVAVRLTLN